MVSRNVRKLGKKKGLGTGLAVIGGVILILFLIAFAMAVFS